MSSEYVRVSAIPGGYLISGMAVGESDLRERWLRTRPDFIVKILQQEVHQVGRNNIPIVDGIKRALISALQEFKQRKDSIWELQEQTGAIVYVDWSLPRKSVVASEQIDLRGIPMKDLHLPTTILTNRVASYLGRPTVMELGWKTAAPVAGVTANWNGYAVRSLTWSGHSHSYAASRKAALLEGIERRVGALQSDSDYVTSTAEDLPGRVITPEDFPPYPAAFFRGRGARFDPTSLHEWVQVTNARDGSKAWMPREYVYYGQQMHNTRWALTSSSGCATGSSVSEAMLFGILELIERDAYVGSWYGDIPPTPIDSDFLPSSLSSKIARLSFLGYSFKCAWLPSVNGVPVILVHVFGDTRLGLIGAIGTAAHPDPYVACIGAFEEAWTYICARMSISESMMERARILRENPTLCQDIDDHPLLLINPQIPDYQNLCGTGDPVRLARTDIWRGKTPYTIDAVLSRLIRELSDLHMDLWYRLQTSAFERSLGLETVMVLAPDLLPIDFGWDLQRALQAHRLCSVIRNYHGYNRKPRMLPHPFS